MTLRSCQALRPNTLVKGTLRLARAVIFDPFSGASGDMILGALVDLGVPLAIIQTAVSQLGVEGVRISAEPAHSGAVRGTRVTVAAPDGQPSRDWRAIRELLEASALTAPERDAALSVFALLAAAEAEAHDEPVEDVHFHEVGAVDAIVDVVGACAGLAYLGTHAIYAHPVATGVGWVRADHGLLPVPAPATAIVLAQKQLPTRPAPATSEPPGELLTPTGAAILGALAEWRVPAFIPERVGYGFGTRELPWPNALRAWLGDVAEKSEEESGELLLETNIDDMNPQFFELLVERLYDAGALDVWLSPAIMKKGRPATVVSAITPASRQEAVERAMILESTTLGVRATPISRTKAPRRFVTVATRWGDVRLKLRGWDGRVIGAMPEYDDCLRLARESSAPIQEVWAEANRIGEVFVGQRWDDAEATPRR